MALTWLKTTSGALVTAKSEEEVHHGLWNFSEVPVFWGKFSLRVLLTLIKWWFRGNLTKFLVYKLLYIFYDIYSWTLSKLGWQNYFVNYNGLNMAQNNFWCTSYSHKWRRGTSWYMKLFRSTGSLRVNFPWEYC